MPVIVGVSLSSTVFKHWFVNGKKHNLLFKVWFLIAYIFLFVALHYLMSNAHTLGGVFHRPTVGSFGPRHCVHLQKRDVETEAPVQQVTRGKKDRLDSSMWSESRSLVTDVHLRSACGFIPEWNEGSQGGIGTALALLTWWGHWLRSSSPETEGHRNENKNHLSDLWNLHRRNIQVLRPVKQQRLNPKHVDVVLYDRKNNRFLIFGASFFYY